MSTSTPLRVEIAVQDRVGVRVAAQGGADRVELCTALSVGGLTPSAGLIELAVHEADARQSFVNVLIRPRGGGFVYTTDEIDTMIADVRQAVRLGAHGIVTGAMTPSGLLDTDALARLIDAAENADVTVHRVVDAVADPCAAVRTLTSFPVRRILTSGGAQAAGTGIPVLQEMVKVAEGIEIMAGGGVRVSDIAALAQTGISAVHLSARSSAHAGPSGPGGGVGEFEVTDPAIVADAVARAATLR